ISLMADSGWTASTNQSLHWKRDGDVTETRVERRKVVEFRPSGDRRSTSRCPTLDGSTALAGRDLCLRLPTFRRRRAGHAGEAEEIMSSRTGIVVRLIAAGLMLFLASASQARDRQPPWSWSHAQSTPASAVPRVVLAPVDQSKLLAE